MEIIIASDKDQWNKFVIENSSPSSFLQSWQWGEFQAALGNKIHRVVVMGDDGKWLAAAQIVVRSLYLGKTYLEVAKGPVGNFDKAVWETLVAELKTIAAVENAVLVRISPPYQNKFQISNFKFQKPEILQKQMEPEDTVLVDLTKPEDQLMSKMHEKSRYNIRLAMKKGVRVEDKTGDSAGFEKFLELIAETSKRDGITVWPRKRFEKFREHFMYAELPPTPSLIKGGETPSLLQREGKGEFSPRAILLTGEYEGKTLAATIIMLFGDSGTYLYAASSAEMRNANVPSLVLWEAIRAAKAAGKKYYDMWGIAPPDASESHSWSGITRFKSRYVAVGETGLEKHYLGTRDLVINRKYYSLFKLAKKIRG